MRPEGRTFRLGAFPALIGNSPGERGLAKWERAGVAIARTGESRLRERRGDAPFVPRSPAAAAARPGEPCPRRSGRGVGAPTKRSPGTQGQPQWGPAGEGMAGPFGPRSDIRRGACDDLRQMPDDTRWAAQAMGNLEVEISGAVRRCGITAKIAQPLAHPTPPTPVWAIRPGTAARRTRTIPACRRPAARHRCGASPWHRTRC